MLNFIKQDINPDLFFWTGDNPAHNVWDITQADVIQTTAVVTSMIKDTFKDSSVEFYAIHGNHETHPVNIQDFTTPNSDGVINGLADVW